MKRLTWHNIVLQVDFNIAIFSNERRAVKIQAMRMDSILCKAKLKLHDQDIH